MKIITTLFLGLLAIGFTGCANNKIDGDLKKMDSRKPAIVLVAFGTSVDKARKVFDHIDKLAKKRYPNYEIKWAFTSSFIRKKLAKRNIITYSPQEIVDQLKALGYSKAVFQSLHIAPGQEFKSVSKINTRGLKIEVGQALLSSNEDIARVIKCLTPFVDKSAANVVVCHGNERYPEHNAQLIKFATKMQNAFSGKVVVNSVEGQISKLTLSDAKKMAKRTGKVNFIPLMIVAGDHIMNDIMGDEPEAWKNFVSAKKTTVTKPVGYNDCIMNIFFDHLDKALFNLK